MAEISPNPRRRRSRAERRAEWQTHVERWQRSGQSKLAYCRAHELNPASFYQWCRKLLGGESERPWFVLVHLPVAASSIELTLSGGQRLRCSEGVDVVWVSRLVRELERAC